MEGGNVERLTNTTICTVIKQTTYNFPDKYNNITWSCNHFKKRANRKAKQVGINRKINMLSNSVTLHRVLKATPEKVYRAFTEPNALAFWIPPYGFLCVVHNMDVRVSGSYKMSFINFSTGNGHSFGGIFLEIKPNEFLKHTDKFDDPNLPGEMTTSIWLKKVF